MTSNLDISNDKKELHTQTKDSAKISEMIDRFAAELYSLASMFVGEGEESVRLVEAAVAEAEVSACHDPEDARRSARKALASAAMRRLELREPGCLATPEWLKPSETCIDQDDLNAAGVSRDELETMIAGPDRLRVRRWLASLPTPVRVVFLLRAVAGVTTADAAAMLHAAGGPNASTWNPGAVSDVFRQGLCSLASQLIHAETAGE